MFMTLLVICVLGHQHHLDHRGHAGVTRRTTGQCRAWHGCGSGVGEMPRLSGRLGLGVTRRWRECGGCDGSGPGLAVVGWRGWRTGRRGGKGERWTVSGSVEATLCCAVIGATRGSISCIVSYTKRAEFTYCRVKLMEFSTFYLKTVGRESFKPSD